ncbi:protein of unknown function [Marinobacter daqiaonensis]|uniref:DUF349 domain-containing protein n=1 Tax=Marinobacter daqiaonensis TaxID=650891 RepID=A0A1I6JI49_9GAMM|nr:DUF349 domain-containing protein [Marinobacter daqiaonensis]SFR78706.1 protein of unknown function [Marinobacter daqiaonensis]
MAAFIQKLFKKRTASATRPDTDSRKKQPAQDRPDPASESPVKSPEQALIDQQRAKIAEPDPDQETLAELATHGLAADIRLDAVRRVTDESLLQRVQKATRGRDKGVYQHARQALQEIRQRQARAQQTRDDLAKLTNQAKELALTSDTSLYEARVEKLEQAWSTLEPAATNEEKAEILAALHDCRQRAGELAAQREEVIRRENQREQRELTLTLLKETIADLEREQTDHATLPSLDALQRTQENRWLEATRETDVSKSEQKDYESLMQTLKSHVAALRRLGVHQEQIQALLDDEVEPDPEAARALLENLEWPGSLPRPEALERLARAANVRRPVQQVEGDREQQKVLQERLDRVLGQLEQTLAENLLKESRQNLKQAQALHRQLTGKEARHHQGNLQRLAGQVRELGDWRGFATGPKQAALCEQMEYLAEQPMDPEAKAARIQELQQEWKNLGGSSDRDLWQRFRTASDAAFEPCKAYFEARSDLKKVNLQKRQTLCEELARYLEAADWATVDWKAAEQIEKTARQEWREAWPVEFRDNRPIQKRFDQLMAELGRRLDEERLHNEALKQGIVDEAQALIDHTPLNEAMDRAKALQKQWQEIGVTRHREDRKLWKAFRAACDQIFSRRDEERQLRNQQVNEADETAAPLLAKAQAALDADSLDEPAVRTLRDQLREAAASPVSSKVGKQLQDCINRLEERRKQEAVLANTRQWQDWIRQRTLGPVDASTLPRHWQTLQSQVSLAQPQEVVVLAEILTGTPSSQSDQNLRMELQVRRLKEGLAGSATPSDQDLEALVARWCLDLDGENPDPALAERFCDALQPR